MITKRCQSTIGMERNGLVYKPKYFMVVGNTTFTFSFSEFERLFQRSLIGTTCQTTGV
jgi:hypothetical protein